MENSFDKKGPSITSNAKEFSAPPHFRILNYNGQFAFKNIFWNEE